MRSATTGHFWFGSFLFLCWQNGGRNLLSCVGPSNHPLCCVSPCPFSIFPSLFCVVMTTLVCKDCWLLWVQLWLVLWLGFVVLKDISGERRRRNHVDERSWCVMLWPCCVCEVGCHVWGARILVGSGPVWGRLGDGLFGTVVA